MGYISKLGNNEAIMDGTPIEIPFDLFRLFVRNDELKIIAESIGYDKSGELGVDEDLRFYSGLRENQPCVAIGSQSTYNYHVFTVDDMERPFTEKSLFYWCGLYLSESYTTGSVARRGLAKTSYFVRWEDEDDRAGQGEGEDFKTSVINAMKQQMNLQPVSKPKTKPRKRLSRRTK